MVLSASWVGNAESINGSVRPRLVDLPTPPRLQARSTERVTLALLAAALIFTTGPAGADGDAETAGVERPVAIADRQQTLSSTNPLARQEVSSTATSSIEANQDQGPLAEQGDIVVTARKDRPDDPLSRVNAKSFEATQAVDQAIVGPVALAYKKVLPSPVRSGLRNFLYNLHEPDVFINYVLQHRIGKAAETFGRFALNSTLGVGGIVDIAKRHPFKLPRRPNGFADTFGFYGIKNGPFLYLPLIGPTTLRDLAGGMLDRFVLPVAIGNPFNRLAFSVPVGVLSTLDHRAEFDDQLHELHDGVADPYASSRDFYLRRRQQEIDHIRGRPRLSRQAPQDHSAAVARHNEPLPPPIAQPLAEQLASSNDRPSSISVESRE